MHADLFDGLIGHGAIAHILQSSIRKPAPAYLFIGQQHLGKRTFAERFIRLLLDRAPNAHPDFILLEPEDGKKQISVEQVRKLRERVALRPISSKRTVIFIPSADRLNESGTNALLKILEEPPADAVFILVAEDPERLPATVLSRSVVLSFTIVPKQEIVDGLVHRGCSLQDAQSNAARAHGRPGLAIAPPEGKELGASFAESFLAAKTLGARLWLIEEISKTCDASEEAGAAWRDALRSAMHATRKSFLHDPISATLFGISLITAVRFIGSPISPRLALEAGATRLATNPAMELRHLFPEPLPRSLPLIYESLVQ